jgi:peptidoglycan-N-acetylglucosamine deacetylase
VAQLWRPIALAGVVAALVFSAAMRGGDDPADAQLAVGPTAESTAEPTVERVAISRGSGKAFVPVSGAGPRPPAGTVASPPAPAVDDIGTRRLTGYVRLNVALTFDDGPHPEYTPAVLAILREHGVTATFCVVGAQVQSYPDLVREIAADGHALCNHTVTHDTKLPNKDEATIAAELADTHEAIVAAAPGTEVHYFRAPGGNFAGNVNAVAEAHGLTPLGWSLDTEDWRKPGADTIRDRVIGGIHPGAIVLIHDGGGDRSASVAALPAIVTTLLDEGYRFVVPSR